MTDITDMSDAKVNQDQTSNIGKDTKYGYKRVSSVEIVNSP